MKRFLAILLVGAIGCPRAVPVEDRLPAAPPLDRGLVDEGALGQVKRPSRLTADPAQEYDPAPSPDGSVIAFVSHRRGNADIFLRFLPGSGRVGEYPIVDHYAADNDPVWAPNGRQIAFVSRRDDPKGDLYIYSLKSGDAVPDAIRDAIFKKFGEALSSPDSGWDAASREQLERVSEFLEKRDPTIRLIDAERENRAPAWSPDGRTLYYAARKPGEPENIWAIELRTFDRKQITTDGGFDAAPSPDGKRLAYTARNGARTIIRIRDLASGKATDLTGGDPRTIGTPQASRGGPGAKPLETIDGFPAWSGDGKTLFFSRYSDDTNEDGKVDVNDRPSIHEATLDGKLVWPVTPAGKYDLFPSVAGGRLFWSSEGFGGGTSGSTDGTNTDVWSIPEKGIFPALGSSKEELELADSLAGESELRLLLLEQIAAKRPGEDPIAQDARIAAARLRADRRELDAATGTVKSMLADSRVTGARKARAQVLLGRIAALRAEKSGPGGSLDKPALRAAAEMLEKAADSFAADLKAQKAEAFLEAGLARAKADDRLAATESWQKGVASGADWPRAEAWLAAAMAYGDLGQADRSVATFLAALQAYPDVVVPAERRKDLERERRRMLDRIEKAVANTEKKGAQTTGIDTAGLPDVGVPETYGERAAEGVAAAAILGSQGGPGANARIDGHAAIAALRDLANRHKDLPVLPSLARNEIGDLYVLLGDLESASLEYAAVANGGGDPRQVQRAQLSGAKALLIAGRYAEAVKALGPPPPPEIPGGAKAALARRARKAYTRTLLAKADEELRSKDVKLARKSYRAVLAVDAREVRAHRGLIACYAALGEADRVAQIYEDEAKKTPEDPLIRYGVGLAYTYRSPEEKWLAKAEEELKRAVFLDDTQVFPHQTLGFVYEKQEELFGEKDGFERAADQYLLALSLNDVKDDYRNEADLLLNAGNAFFNLQNYRRAYEFYSRREKSSVPFDLAGRELVFRERIAKASFESNRIEESVQRYDVALQYLDALPESDRKGVDVAEHRARLLDERAFALDQGRQPAKAAEAYLDAAKANSIAGNEQNSARALRNAAINLFEKGTGDPSTATDGPEKKALVDALEYLEQSLEGVGKHGVVKQKEKKGKKALFSYNMNMSLSLDGSEAIDGFSKQGEQELIFTFVGKIYDSLDDPQRARELYEKKKGMLPAKVPAEQQASLNFKRALLENQIGVLAWATGDAEAAWKNLKDSYDHSLQIGNVHGGMTNAANLALIAIESGDAAKEKAALEVVKDALSLLANTATPDPERYYSALHAAKGELLVRQASRAGGADLKAALAAFAEQQKLLAEAEKAFLDARSAIDGAKKPVAEMNRDRVVALRGLGRIASIDGRRETAARHYEEARRAAWTHGFDALALQIEAEGLVLTNGAAAKKETPKPDVKEAPGVVSLADPASAKAVDERLDAVLAKLEKVPAPILGRELDLAGIEPYYRRLAARALEKGDALAALATMERLRGLQLVARAGGVVPKGRTAEIATASDTVTEKSADVARAQKALATWTQPASGKEWEAKRLALDTAADALAAAVEEWGSWDETAWALAHVAPADPGMLAIATPGDAAFLYYVATGDALWSLTCKEGECSAAKIGPSPAVKKDEARAAAAKALSEAAAKTTRVLLVPDAGLYDGAWIPADAWKGKAFSVFPSAASIIAADAKRGPYRERQDVASTAGAVNLLAAATRADVIRLDVPGTIVKGRPLISHWELTKPEGPPPVRRVTAKDVMVSGMQPALVVADVGADSDPETMLALADLWIRGGAGTVLFYPAAETQRADKVAKGEIALAEAAPMFFSGHPGMNADEEKQFGDEAVGSTIDLANAAMSEGRWDDAMASLDRALYLIDALKVDGPKTDVLDAATVAAYNAQQWVRGERYASELVKAIENKGEKSQKHADALVLRGIMEQRAERFDAAIATLELAAQRYKDLGIPEGLSRSLSSLGATFEKKLDSKQAIETFRSAMKVEEELGRTSGIGDLHRKIGRVQYLFLEDYSKAEEHFAKARDAYAKAKDAKGEDEARLEIGLVAERRGALDDSKAAYQEVYDRAKKRNDEAIRGKAALFLANTAWLSGDYQTAFARVREVRRIAEETKSDRLAFLARSTEGLLHWTLNDLPRAIALQQEALKIAEEKLDSPLDVASTWNNLGIIHRSGESYDEAVKCFETALAIDKRVGSRWGQAYDLRNLGLTWLLSAQPARAGEPLQEAVTLAASIGDKVNGAKATLALGDFHRIQGDTAKARALYQQAVAQSDASHLPEVKWRAHRGLASIATMERDYAKARAELDAALNVVEALRGAIKVEELKNGFIADKLDLYDDAIQLALEHPPEGADKATLAWTYSERSRARSFIDLLANRKVDLSDPADTKRIDAQRKLKDEIYAAEDAVAKAPDADKAKRLADLEKLREKYRDLLIEIRAANPKLSAFVTVEPPTLADVRKVIGTDTALLEYHVGEKGTLVWTITAESIVVRRIDVSGRTLAEQVKTYLNELEAVRPVDARSRKLHDLLVAPALGPETKGKRYVGVIPHGVLHYVPFAALKGENDYLIDRFALFYVPSAAVLPLTATNTKVTAKSEAKVLAIGNPDLGDPSYALPFAELEVGDLRLDFPQIDVLTRERATDRWVAKNISSYQVIHFACHGEFDPVNPLFSSLRLARESQSDGALEAHEIFGLPLRAELVTLSACRTGLGKIEAGDELIGLNRAFLYAGTQSIMSTLWRVHDGSTAVLVKHFYRGYAREPKADALRDAMRQVREYYPHPAYWAAFALTGEYR